MVAAHTWSRDKYFKTFSIFKNNLYEVLEIRLNNRSLRVITISVGSFSVIPVDNWTSIRRWLKVHLVQMDVRMMSARSTKWSEFPPFFDDVQ